MGIPSLQILRLPGAAEILAASLPTSDWQFWAVSGIFIFALAWLLRGVLPIPILSRRSRRRRKGERPAVLTISGRPMKKRR